MGKLTALKDLAKNNIHLATRAAKLMPRVALIAKGFGKERVAAALASDESMAAFAGDIYEKLPIEMQKDINKEYFSELIIQNKNKLMGKKKYKKRLKK